MAKPFTPNEFKAIYSKVPRLCVDLNIKTDKGVILTKRSLPTYHGLWHLPGGTVYYKEPLINAAKRIAKDEVNIDIEVLFPIGVIEYESEEQERGYGFAVSVVLLCHMLGGVIKPGEGASEVSVFQTVPDNLVPDQKKFTILT